MPTLPSGYQFPNYLTPNSNINSYEGTVHDMYLKGGFQSVNSISERNLIPIKPDDPAVIYNGFTDSGDGGWTSGRRKVGMLVHVLEDQRFYILLPVGYFGNEGSGDETAWLALSEAERALRLYPTGTFTVAAANPGNNFTAQTISATDLGISADANSCWVELELKRKGDPIDGHLIPDTNEVYDLGSPEKKFRDLYLSGNTLYMGGQPLSVVNGQLTLNGQPISGNLDTQYSSYEETSPLPLFTEWLLTDTYNANNGGGNGLVNPNIINPNIFYNNVSISFDENYVIAWNEIRPTISIYSISSLDQAATASLIINELDLSTIVNLNPDEHLTIRGFSKNANLIWCTYRDENATSEFTDYGFVLFEFDPTSQTISHVHTEILSLGGVTQNGIFEDVNLYFMTGTVDDSYITTSSNSFYGVRMTTVTNPNTNQTNQTRESINLYTWNGTSFDTHLLWQFNNISYPGGGAYLGAISGGLKFSDNEDVLTFAFTDPYAQEAHLVIFEYNGISWILQQDIILQGDFFTSRPPYWDYDISNDGQTIVYYDVDTLVTLESQNGSWQNMVTNTQIVNDWGIRIKASNYTNISLSKDKDLLILGNKLMNYQNNQWVDLPALYNIDATNTTSFFGRSSIPVSSHENVHWSKFSRILNNKFISSVVDSLHFPRNKAYSVIELPTTFSNLGEYYLSDVEFNREDHVRLSGFNMDNIGPFFNNVDFSGNIPTLDGRTKYFKFDDVLSYRTGDRVMIYADGFKFWVTGRVVHNDKVNKIISFLPENQQGYSNANSSTYLLRFFNKYNIMPAT